MVLPFVVAIGGRGGDVVPLLGGAGAAVCRVGRSLVRSVFNARSPVDVSKIVHSTATASVAVARPHVVLDTMVPRRANPRRLQV